MLENGPVLSLADLEAFDPGAREGHRERRFCCPLPACAGKRVDPAHRSLSVNVQTGAWTCHRCGAKGCLRERWRQRPSGYALRRAFAIPSGAGKTGKAEAAGFDWRWAFAAATRVDGTAGGRYLD